MSEIARLQAVTGIPDLAKFGREEAVKILDDLSNGKISKADMSSLLGAVPTAGNVIVQTLKTIDLAVGQAGTSQSAILKATIERNKKSLDVLEQLANNCTSDETRVHVAEHISEITKSFNNATTSINNSNNSFWKTVAGVGACVGVIGLIAMSAKKA